MKHVYVLNNSYECISQTSFSRANQMVEDGRAEVVKWADETICTVNKVLRIPRIIRIFKYVRAFGRAMRFVPRFVWDRDGNICQYCKKKITKKADLTIDHVMPQSRGGRLTYENAVTACRPCNQKKADRTPEEAGMRLLREPTRPMMSKSMARIADEAKGIMDEMEW